MLTRRWKWFAVACIALWGTGADAAWPWTTTTKTSVPHNRTSSTPLLNGKPLVTNTAGSSTWNSVASGTKKVAAGTVDLITLKPLRDNWSSSSSKKPSRPMVSAKKKPTSSGFGSWFKPKEEKKIKTVGDWMAQPRPGV